MSRNRNTFAHWNVLADGGSGTYLYAREAAPGVFIFIEIMDLPSMMGREATVRWSASVSVVDLNAVKGKTLTSAVRSCGGDFLYKVEGGPTPLMLAEILHSYGAKSPMWSGEAGKVNERNYYDRPGEGHRPFRDLRAVARRKAEALLDADTRDNLLDTRIVNKLGQTAREYAGGPGAMWGTLRRIAANPEATPEQALMLTLYAGARRTLGGDVVPADLRK